MKFTESQIQNLAPDDASFKAGKALSGKNQWLAASFTERSLWGEIKGSGSKPYQTQVDINAIAIPQIPMQTWYRTFAFVGK